MVEATGTEDSPVHRKARGAFFTPPQLCSYICDWAVRGPGDRVLEPSCGQAAFLVAAARRLDALGAGVDPEQLVGVDVHAGSVATAQGLVAAAGRPVQLRVGDFFGMAGERRFDAVIGNPPYMRYQGFTGALRAAGRRAALNGGVGLTALASSWAAFTVHAAEFLRPGGRLGLVLPAELLTVNYAAEVRRYLMARFGRVRLVVFTERVFPGVLEEVVLLLAEDALAPGGTDHCELRQVSSVAELARELPEGDADGTASVPLVAGGHLGEMDTGAAAGIRPAGLRHPAGRGRFHRPASLGGDHAGRGDGAEQLFCVITRAGTTAAAARRRDGAAVPAGQSAPAWAVTDHRGVAGAG